MVLSGEFGFDMEVCEDECTAFNLCLEFWEMEHNLKKCVLAIKKTCKCSWCLEVRMIWGVYVVVKMYLQHLLWHNGLRLTFVSTSPDAISSS